MNMLDVMVMFGYSEDEYADLNYEDKSFLQSWVDRLNSSQVTVEDERRYLNAMIEDIEKKLPNTNLTKAEDLILKAELNIALLFRSLVSRENNTKNELEAYIQRRKSLAAAKTL